jgi:hypothetical protein
LGSPEGYSARRHRSAPVNDHASSATMTTTAAMKITAWTFGMRHMAHRPLCTERH